MDKINAINIRQAPNGFTEDLDFLKEQAGILKSTKAIFLAVRKYKILHEEIKQANQKIYELSELLGQHEEIAKDVQRIFSLQISVNKMVKSLLT